MFVLIGFANSFLGFTHAKDGQTPVKLRSRHIAADNYQYLQVYKSKYFPSAVSVWRCNSNLSEDVYLCA